VALLSCSMNGTAQSPNASSNADIEVRIQVCIPTKRIYFDDVRLERLENHPQFTRYSEQQLELAPKTIRRAAPSSDPRVTGDPSVIRNYGINFGEVLNRSGLYSDGSGFMPLRDSTTADQPVYEKGYGYPAKNYVAMHVRIPEGDMGQGARVPTYWFRLPGTIPADGFSDWFPPASMESGSTTGSSSTPVWYRLTHGGDLPIYPVSADAPKMRVTLLRQKPTHNDPTTDFLPALTTARLRLRTATSGPQFVYEFVSKTNEVVPKCD
jgi:hypothetical protein